VSNKLACTHLKGKDGSSIDFMALTMINPASSWFKVVELSTVMQLMTKKVNGKERTIKEGSSISHLIESVN
jgi:hypothetical protein